MPTAKRWQPKHDAPADWPTLADYEQARRANAEAHAHDWQPIDPKKPRRAGYVCAPCDVRIPAPQDNATMHLPYPSAFRAAEPEA